MSENIKVILKKYLKISAIIFLKFINSVGAGFIKLNETIGNIVLFLIHFFKSIFFPEFFSRRFFQEILKLGFLSIPLISIISFFTGAVLSLQLYTTLSKIGIIDQIPTIVVVALCKELGPVLAAIMLSARSGSSICSEIAYMQSTNQIDTLKSISANIPRFLFLPKILALICFSPIILILFVLAGLFGSSIVLERYCDFLFSHYVLIALDTLDFEMIRIGLIKILTFSTLISFVSIYNGHASKGGSAGVSSGIINSIMINSILILALNFTITFIFENK